MMEEQPERRAEQPAAVAVGAAEAAKVVAQAGVTKTQRINSGLYVTVLVCVAIIGTLAALLWQGIEQRASAEAQRDRIEYFICLTLYSQGVNEKSCERYQEYINSHTNVKNPGGQLDGGRK